MGLLDGQLQCVEELLLAKSVHTSGAKTIKNRRLLDNVSHIVHDADVEDCSWKVPAVVVLHKSV